MSPDDVALVGRSWAELRLRREDLIARLAAPLATADPPDGSARAGWLVDSVAELVDLLAAPSQLGQRARLLALRRPCPGSAPSFRVDGRAWMGAAPDVGASWTVATEQAWCHAWLLLSDVLAEETLSPFANP